MKYAIFDWIGNLVHNDTFTTFEDAWDYILGDLTDKLDLTEEDYQEYYVDRVSNIRESRYIDPNDTRKGYKNA